MVVSLKPFVPVNARLSERNVRGSYEKKKEGMLTGKPVSRSTISVRYSM